VNAVRDSETFVAVDGYHAFMAIRTDLGAIAGRAFYVAGGLQIRDVGRRHMLLHCPPGYGARPRDTGWYAGFSALESGQDGVGYAADGSRFLGATFDVSGLYRFNAVQDWLASEGQTVVSMLDHVRSIERAFLTELDRSPAAVDSHSLVAANSSGRGRFLALRTNDAAAIAARLAQRNIIVDLSRHRLRIGFGIYHSPDDAIRVASALRDRFWSRVDRQCFAPPPIEGDSRQRPRRGWRRTRLRPACRAGRCVGLQHEKSIAEGGDAGREIMHGDDDCRAAVRLFAAANSIRRSLCAGSRCAAGSPPTE